MRKVIFVAMFIIFIVGYTLVYSEDERGSCEIYADIVCDICGEDHTSCIQMRDKAVEIKEHSLCAKAVKHLPSAYKNASDLSRSLLKKAVCDKKMPETTKAPGQP
ncbi:MAG TPA: hypothetical protein P5123_02575 [Spirochaetota bacterium]|nr:hypothetical protein [Spirochaetota bacterium]